MISLNPYTYIGGAVILAAIGGSLWYQGTQIHHWHTKYLTDEKVIAVLADKVVTMTRTQNTQTSATDQSVIKVVQGPGTVQTIIKQIHDAPNPSNCKTPTLSEEVRNAL